MPAGGRGLALVGAGSSAGTGGHPVRPGPRAAAPDRGRRSSVACSGPARVRPEPRARSGPGARWSPAVAGAGSRARAGFGWVRWGPVGGRRSPAMVGAGSRARAGFRWVRREPWSGPVRGAGARPWPVPVRGVIRVRLAYRGGRLTGPAPPGRPMARPGRDGMLRCGASGPAGYGASCRFGPGPPAEGAVRPWSASVRGCRPGPPRVRPEPQVPRPRPVIRRSGPGAKGATGRGPGDGRAPSVPRCPSGSGAPGLKPWIRSWHGGGGARPRTIAVRGAAYAPVRRRAVGPRPGGESPGHRGRPAAAELPGPGRPGAAGAARVCGSRPARIARVCRSRPAPIARVCGSRPAPTPPGRCGSHPAAPTLPADAASRPTPTVPACPGGRRSRLVAGAKGGADPRSAGAYCQP